jgi:hypothetical protein
LGLLLELGVSQLDHGLAILGEINKFKHENMQNPWDIGNNSTEANSQEGNKESGKKESCSLGKKIAKGVAKTGGAVAGVFCIPIVMGFGTGGIVAGSIAAGIQSSIGNVAIGSMFAFAQSAGATGTFAAIAGSGAVVGTGAGITAAIIK